MEPSDLLIVLQDVLDRINQESGIDFSRREPRLRSTPVQKERLPIPLGQSVWIQDTTTLTVSRYGLFGCLFHISLS